MRSGENPEKTEREQQLEYIVNCKTNLLIEMSSLVPRYTQFSLLLCLQLLYEQVHLNTFFFKNILSYIFLNNKHYGNKNGFNPYFANVLQNS